MLAVVVPRFSRAAIVSVAVLLSTGIVASIVHLPTLESLWETNYGLALIAKSVLLACALVLGGRQQPALAAAPRRRRASAATGSSARARRDRCSGSCWARVALLVGAVVVPPRS